MEKRCFNLQWRQDTQMRALRLMLAFHPSSPAMYKLPSFEAGFSINVVSGLLQQRRCRAKHEQNESPVAFWGP